MSTPQTRIGGHPLELIAPTPQTVWGMPAVLNLSLGGLGAGFYVAASGLGTVEATELAAWLAPALVLTGFAAVACEAGRPLRVVRALRGVATSWMSRELWLGGLFVLLALVGDAVPRTGLRPLAAAAAVALVLAQGFMLTKARAVTAWSVPMVPAVFAAAAAVSGVSLLLLTELLGGRLPGRSLLATTAVVLALGLLVWWGFLASSADAAFVRATAPLRGGATALEILGAGYALPLVLIALALASPAWAPVPTALAAGLALVGQFRARSALILAAGRRRPVTLATLTPRRTSR
jgi:formate-dependent nitrite reductase membrane component NrfD